MKNKGLIKFISAVLIWICFAVICNHMPQILQVFYDGVFRELDIPRLLFVIGLLVCETIILKKWRGEKYFYICLGGVFIASALILINGNSSLYDKLRPSTNVTAIDQDLCSWSKDIFRQYYFEDKNLLISNEEKATEDEFSYIYKMGISPQKVIVGKEVQITEELKSKIASYPRWRDELCRYVIDEYWESTNNIRLVKIEGKYIFCSEEIVENTQNYDMIVDETTEMDSSDAFAMMGEKIGRRPYKNFKQVVAMITLVFIGLLVVLPLWGKDYPLLSLFISFPIGVASWCICGLLFTVLNIPYNLFTVFGCLIVCIGIWVFKKRHGFLNLNWPLLLNYMLILVGVIVLLVYLKTCFMTSDSVGKCVLGYRLAKFGSIRDILGIAAPYGILEIMIISIGFMMDCDLLYSFYPLMALSGIGIMIAGTYYVNFRNEERDCFIPSIILGGGVIFLLTNYDFVLSAFYVMSHGSIAVYMLILVAVIVIRRQNNLPGFEYVLIMAGTMILITRVEGAIYVLFVLVISLGIENKYLKMKTINVIIPVLVILWNLFQFMLTGTSGDPSFWTPKKGILLIIGSIGTLIITLIFRIQWMVINYIRNYYFLSIMLAIGGVTALAAFYKRDMAAINLPMYLSHFSNSVQNDTNSAALWTYLLLICPIIIRYGKAMARYSITFICGYIILTYFIFLFRTGLPIHLGYTDSSRRMLVHIMPIAIWLLANSIGNDNYLKTREGNED